MTLNQKQNDDDNNRGNSKANPYLYSERGFVIYDVDLLSLSDPFLKYGFLPAIEKVW